MKPLFLLLLACFLPQNDSYRIESTYDRFTDETTVTASYFHLIKTEDRFNHTINMRALYSYKGNKDKIAPPSEVVLEFFVGGKSPFDSSTALYVIADEDRYQFARDDEDLGAATRINIRIPFSRFEKIVNAKTLEMRLGSVELDISNDDIRGLRDFLPRKVESH